MKFLKIRHVFMTLIVLALGITALLYFVGGLSASVLKNNNLAFDEEQFTVDMEKLQTAQRKISFDPSVESNVIDNIVNQLNEKYTAERVDVKNNRSIYVDLKVKDNAVNDEVHQVKGIIGKIMSDDFAFNSLENAESHLEITAVSSNAISALQSAKSSINSISEKITVEGNKLIVKFKDTEITKLLSATVLSNLKQIDDDIKNGITPDPALVQSTNNAKDAAITKLVNRAIGAVSELMIKTVTYSSSIYETDLIVAQNDKFTMYFNEATTYITVGVNESAELMTTVNDKGETVPLLDLNGYKKYKNFKTVYKTSEVDGGNVLVLYYFGENGKVSANGVGTYAGSVQYYDLLLQKNTRHYSINYNVDNGVEVLYNIGSFLNINSFFPEEIEREALESYVRGNFWAVQQINHSTNNMYYTGAGFTTNAECVAYLEENGLAVATEATQSGSPLGYWVLSDMLVDSEDVASGKYDKSRLGEPKAQIGVDYNTADPTASPCTSNPFLSNLEFNLILSQNGFILKDDYSTGRTDVSNMNYTDKSPLSYKSNVSKTSAPNKTGIYNFLYNISDTQYLRKNGHIETDFSDKTIIYFKGKPVLRGGVHQRDENGNFMYDEDGNPVRGEFPKKVVDEQNEKYGNAAAAANKVFRVGVRFELSETGFDVSILENSIIEGRKAQMANDPYAHEYKLASVDVLPNFNVNNSSTSKGEIIIPDGSGAVISFNSPKDIQNVSSYSAKPIYGLDTSFTLLTAPNDVKEIMLGMYGYLDKTNQKGTVAIVDKGAAQTKIIADFKRATGSMYNYAYFITNFRESETVNIGASATKTSYIKWTQARSKNDFIYKYNFITPTVTEDKNLSIDNFNYMTVANVYRDYLTNKYNLTPKDNTTDNVVNIKFLGSFEKRTSSFGIITNKAYSLTTFAQAKQIIQELQSYGLEDFNISYKGWTEDAMHPETTSKVQISKVLGGKKGFNALSKYLNESGIALYPEVNVTTNYGYDYLFGDKYTSRSISNMQSQHWPFALPTGMIDKTKPGINMVSPKFYEEILSDYINSYNKLNIDGITLFDLGNSRTTDYSRKSNIFAYDGSRYQENALSMVNSKVNNVSLSGPFDYALQYATNIVDLPLESTLYQIFDYSIPLYQLILSGLVDYASTPVNYATNYTANWYLLKSLETGSNLQYVLSYEDTNVLLDTDYTDYFNAYYINWKSKIVEMNNEINKTGIHTGRLVYHQYISDSAVRVKYDNGTPEGIELIINFGNTAYVDTETGLSIAPNWYMQVKGGK